MCTLVGPKSGVWVANAKDEKKQKKNNNKETEKVWTNKGYLVMKRCIREKDNLKDSDGMC